MGQRRTLVVHRSARHVTDRDREAGVAARRQALEALVRIETEGAYANLVTNAILDRSGLEPRDRHFVTDLVYGSTRMRRACDHLVDRHRRGDVSARVGAALRLGAYQLAFADVAPHAAVDATVAAAPKPARGLVNAVLRRVADDVAVGIEWPDEATRLSYPTWIVGALTDRLGAEDALAALEAMNRPATTFIRDDGYVQDPASHRVVDALGAGPDDLVLDLCAAPGGKATGIAASGARVVAGDRTMNRAGLIVGNAERLGARVPVVVADATKAPFAPARADRVLVDAPCSGLGVLRRRPDARWNLDVAAPERLASLQIALVEEAARLVAPAGTLVYAVCTLTTAENQCVVDGVELPGDFGPAATETLVPDPDHDGMFIATWHRSAGIAPT